MALIKNYTVRLVVAVVAIALVMTGAIVNTAKCTRQKEVSNKDAHISTIIT